MDLVRFAGRPIPFLLHYVRNRRVSHLAILFVVLGAVTCSVSTQYGVKLLIDALAKNNAIWIAFGILVGLIAADNFLWRIATWIASYAFVNVTGDVRRDLFRHLTGHAPAYFSDRLPGTLSSRVTSTANATFAIENMFMWNVLPPCAATVGAIVLVGTVSVPVALVLAGIGIVLIFAMIKLAAAGGHLHHDFADKAARVDGEMVDVIGNMSTVRAFGGITREHRRFASVIGRELLARGRSLRYLEIVRLIHAIITVTFTIGLLYWSLHLWQAGSISVGDVVLICTLGISVLSATRDLAVALVDATQHIARLSEALSTLLEPHQMPDHPAAKPLVPMAARIEFRDVGFAYPGGAPVLENFNLKIESEERVALAGHSGAGKSTLFALLQRFYDPKSGGVLINGQDVSRIERESLHKAFAVVPQDISLFQRSIRENIRYGSRASTDEDVYEAAAAAQCLDFINELPEGFDTIVGDRGAKLSGGQRQRIAIARAFLKDAPILLLDEATSALDVQSEAAIRTAIERLTKGRTVIAIAHRLSTLRAFDRVLVLDSGRIIQDGPHQQLASVNGFYRTLIRHETARLVVPEEHDEMENDMHKRADVS
ncbi:lipid A export ATP-binding/permease protein MsbA [Variibacter gotjawalensis]|uniref:Lipid A export ATP-binding/permease protein MsbA n=1 Tax=Variibacter gotjawalensis TaxID=1333996 RepID=A0A0S3PSE4_9BRAD|nr:ABC transporter ATP-binding protein [Variibacter gotjawalensis]NIK49169.1 ATP-binding cassette subfamily B protein [Variibacter gotjawalensis]RZS51025.1 ATP-binding cassette subfamily B protein [Variibacter gotjawalensis]BAT58859.1 lipid A export ATP-binding/permease protein MsbA [Variibacter gotjawalensis]